MSPHRARLAEPAALSLIPWAAFLAATTAGNSWHDDCAISLPGLLLAAPFYLVFVAGPALLPLAVARHRVTRIVVVVMMTTTAVLAGAAIALSDDAQAGLAVLLVPEVGIPLAGFVWIGQVVVPRFRVRPRDGEAMALGPANISDRLRALTVDVLLVGAVLVVPLTAMSHAGHEVAATAVGIAVGTAYTGIAVAWRGRTIGQWLIGLTVVDAKTRQRLGPTRALARGLVIVLELLGAATMVLSLPALAELLSTLQSGRSLTDRSLRTSVMSRSHLMSRAQVNDLGARP